MKIVNDIYQQVLRFWFEELKPEQWWHKDQKLDLLIRQRFKEAHDILIRKGPELALNIDQFTAAQTLAIIIVLDQFSRNIFRNQPAAFAGDELALTLAKAAVKAGYDHQLPAQQRMFMYMPYMHSESLTTHQQAVKLFTDLNIDSALEFEIKHQKIIQRFGRYPHRNQILGRSSTVEELEFLQQPDSSF